MAGSLYLGNQKVCPAIVLGEQEPTTYDSLLKVPDGVKTISTKIFFAVYTNSWEADPYPPAQKFLVDLNEVEEINGQFAFSTVFFFYDESQCALRAPKLKRITAGGAFNYFMNRRPANASTPTFYEPEIHFNSLESIEGGASFAQFIQSGVTDLYFEKLNSVHKQAFVIMLQKSGKITVHFPSNMEATIQDLNGYPTFGGTNENVTIAFDLPAIE